MPTTDRPVDVLVNNAAIIDWVPLAEPNPDRITLGARRPAIGTRQRVQNST